MICLLHQKKLLDGIVKKAGNAILNKLNQVGTLTETLKLLILLKIIILTL